MNKFFLRQGRLCLTMLALCLLSSCARGPNPEDPYEHYNRNTYRLNDDIDTAVLKPVAKGYIAITNYPIRRSVSNFYSNLLTPTSVLNDALQARVYWTLNDTWRFIINTTVGVLGLFDVASDIGLTPHTNYFGLTLTRWGYTDPSYVVVPFMGPSTMAGLVAIPMNFMTVPWRYQAHPASVQYALYMLQITSIRARYLDQEDLAAQLSFDPYIFMRSAFMQNRNYLLKLNDNPPLKNTLAASEAESSLKNQSQHDLNTRNRKS